METDDISGRIGITVTLFLAEVAFNFVLSSSLPKISYNTSLDEYLIVSYIYIFFSLVESVVIFLLQEYLPQPIIAKYVDWACVCFFFVSYSLYNIYFLAAANTRYLLSL